ncbi:unnamed protein product [Menidia menidia]|uniref:(Atlantic silverside) hypothetical protein n=1 Tax=Menidia menidia TaxID=238744 RepID=A0A8S4BNC6_9TELE|nr:unnamed protein product [Menidia menidia]
MSMGEEGRRKGKREEGRGGGERGEGLKILAQVTCAFNGRQRIYKRAEPGQNVTLLCGIGNKTKILAVEWSKHDLDGENVLLFRDGRFELDQQNPSFKNRVDLQDRQMKDGDVSLILKNVSCSAVVVLLDCGGRRGTHTEHRQNQNRLLWGALWAGRSAHGRTQEESRRLCSFTESLWRAELGLQPPGPPVCQNTELIVFQREAGSPWKQTMQPLEFSGALIHSAILGRLSSVFQRLGASRAQR